jgi:hypothetical protein
MRRKKERRPHSLPLSPVKKDGSEEGRHEVVQCNVHCKFAVKKLPLQLPLMLMHGYMHSLTHSLKLAVFFRFPHDKIPPEFFLVSLDHRPKRLLNKILLLLLLLLLLQEEEEEVGSLCFQETPNLRGVFSLLPRVFTGLQDPRIQSRILDRSTERERERERRLLPSSSADVVTRVFKSSVTKIGVLRKSTDDNERERESKRDSSNSFSFVDDNGDVGPTTGLVLSASQKEVWSQKSWCRK